MTHITMRSYSKKIQWLLAMLCIGAMLPVNCTLDESGKAKKEAEELQALFWVYILTVQYRNRCLEDSNTITAVQGNSYGPFTAPQCFAFSPPSDTTVTGSTTPSNEPLHIRLWNPGYSINYTSNPSIPVEGNGQTVWMQVTCPEPCGDFSMQF